MRVLVILSGVFAQQLLFSQAADPVAVAVESQVPPVVTDDRIFGVIPNFLSVETPSPRTPPLTARQKFELTARSTFDPFNFVAAGLGAAGSQISQGDPKYGQGKAAYFQRYGAAFADMASQNFFSSALLAPLFHEDPRYFRLGPKAHFMHRVGYAFSRSVIGKTDAGKNRISYSAILGTMMGIGLSNAYYPAASRNGGEMAERLYTSFSFSAATNLLPEFWPDIKQKWSKWKH
jgi:hypothetical protein